MADQGSPSALPRRRALKIAGRAGGVAVTLVGLLGTYLAWQAARPPSLAQWTSAATASCEKRAGDLRDPLRSAMETSRQLGSRTLAGPGDVTAVATSLADEATHLEKSADAYRALNGDLRDLDPPGDEAAKVAELLEAGIDLSGDLDAVAAGLREASGQATALVAEGKIDPARIPALSGSLQSVTSALGTAQTQGLKRWDEAVRSLELRQCPGYLAGAALPTSTAPTLQASTTATPTTTATAGGLTDEERSLAQSVGFPAASCSHADPGAAIGVVAAINCAGSGLGYDPAFLRFDSQESLTRWFSPGADLAQSCDTGAAAEGDVPPTAPRLRVRCRPAAGRFSLQARLYAAPIGVAAEDGNPAKLYRWFSATFLS